MAKSQAMTSNLGVDYVIVYRFATTGTNNPRSVEDMSNADRGYPDKTTASNHFEELVHRLASVGLATEVRNGENHSLLLFIRVASEKHLHGEVYRSRVKDWIHGVRSAEPSRETQQSLIKDPMVESERLRIIYQLITNPQAEGGAGITPKKGEWENVESLFSLHDHVYNKEWIKKWATQWLLTPEDLDDIRDRLGEKIGFYFAFTQAYFTFLLFPAGFGIFAWSFLGHFSSIYGIVMSLWCVVFTEYWKHQEHDLALRWGVRGVSQIEAPRHEFQAKTTVRDPITGEDQATFPAVERLQRQLLQVPFTVAAVLLLGTMIATCFAIEVFISEIYSGPGKSLLVFLPTVLLTTGLPLLTGLLTQFATRLTDFENFETESAYEKALTRKIFVLNFITSYLPVLLTAFVYVPFGSIIVPYLDVFALITRPFANSEKELHTNAVPNQFAINPARLRKQVIYFTVTAQIVGFATEIVVPYAKRQGFLKYRQMQSARAQKSSGLAPSASVEDAPEEKEFLARVRSEAELDVYNVYDDLREMVVQYGYLALFSVIWPLVPLSFAINNWVELRADAVKICVEMQRPAPYRADTIGPWLEAISFLGWVGSITGAALVYLFSNDGIGPDGSPSDIKGWGLLLSIFFSEHLFLFARWAVAMAISRIDSPGRQKERRERYLTRQKLFEESLDQTHKLPPMSEKGGEITRTSLEEEARSSSLGTASPEEKFWNRQRNWRESAQIGTGLIERSVPTQKEMEAGEKKEL
ncbi:hypothetical protein LTR15_010495 [Elasticomyces elasticus]|nr:hypothetical protein LTR15_010495 [Elasticomyces elasticus]